jgi:DNA invertase Pin-like site-specific DNA recombinase
MLPRDSTDKIKVAIYARVSTTDQHCDMQLTELRAYVDRSKWYLFDLYVDEGFSGFRRDRPQLKRLLEDANLKRFDIVLVWKIDRFARSVQQLNEYIQTFDRLNVRFIIPSQSIDTDQRNPTARLLLNMLGVLSEFERDLIRERVNAGMTEYQRAHRAGKIGTDRHSRSGKDLPPGRPSKIFRRDEASRLRDSGMSWRKIARKLGVPQSTIRLALKPDSGVQKPALQKRKHALQTKQT